MTINVDDIDLTDTSIYRNGFPHDIFTALRDQAPVWRHPDCPGLKDVGGESFIVLSRYSDIRDVNRNAERFLSVGGAGLGYEPTGLMLTDMDGQRH
ncbi:MAG: cytochrome P450, partial [bacterium]